MKPAIGFSVVLLLASFIACEKDNEYNPYPVWILYTHAVEEENDIGIPMAPVRGCPQTVFRVMPFGTDSTVSCLPNTNVVKVWDHIDSVITIEYYIRCANYYDSEPFHRTFYASEAVHRPGRDGPEAEVVETVILEPQ